MFTLGTKVKNKTNLKRFARNFSREREKKIVFLLSRKIGTIKEKKSLIKSPSFESSGEEKVICLPKAFKCPSMLIADFSLAILPHLKF
jgi:hypothetical protein